MDRAQVETVLIRRCGNALEVVELDFTTVSGTNTDLNDPIFYALTRLGYSVSNPTVVTDAEIAAVEVDEIAAMLDLAELRVLETVQNTAVSMVDVSVGPRRESLSQFSQRNEALIERKRKVIIDDYGGLLDGVGSIETGVISFASLEEGTNGY